MLSQLLAPIRHGAESGVILNVSTDAIQNLLLRQVDVDYHTQRLLDVPRTINENFDAVALRILAVEADSDAVGDGDKFADVRFLLQRVVNRPQFGNALRTEGDLVDHIEGQRSGASFHQDDLVVFFGIAGEEGQPLGAQQTLIGDWKTKDAGIEILCFVQIGDKKSNVAELKGWRHGTNFSRCVL